MCHCYQADARALLIGWEVANEVASYYMGWMSFSTTQWDGHIPYLIWGLVCQKQVSRAWINSYIPHCNWIYFSMLLILTSCCQALITYLIITKSVIPVQTQAHILKTRDHTYFVTETCINYLYKYVINVSISDMIYQYFMHMVLWWCS